VNRMLRLVLLRWHRRLGVAIALVLLMLVVTGVILNHSNELELDKRPVRQALLLQRYGVDLPKIVSFRVRNSYLSLVGSNRLFLDEKEIAYCAAPLYAAIAYDKGIVAVCSDQVLLLNREGEIVERLSEAYGLPPAIRTLATAGGALWLRTENGDYAADLNSLLFTAGPAPVDLPWVQAVQAEAAFKQRLSMQYLGNDVHWERLLLDLHTGRLFGRWGVYVVDAAAIGLLLLSFSGVWVWLTKPGRWR
jgi:hypothetical protein